MTCPDLLELGFPDARWRARSQSDRVVNREPRARGRCHAARAADVSIDVLSSSCAPEGDCPRAAAPPRQAGLRRSSRARLFATIAVPRPGSEKHDDRREKQRLERPASTVRRHVKPAFHEIHRCSPPHPFGGAVRPGRFMKYARICVALLALDSIHLVYKHQASFLGNSHPRAWSASEPSADGAICHGNRPLHRTHAGRMRR